MKLTKTTRNSANLVATHEMTVPVDTSVCGKAFDAVTLDANDLDKLLSLAETDPKRLADWLANLRVRFPVR